LLDHAVELRRAGGIDLPRAIHPQHHLVRVPVGEQVGADREEQRQHHAALAADQVSNRQKQRRHAGQQHRRTEIARHGSPPTLAGPYPRFRILASGPPSICDAVRHGFKPWRRRHAAPYCQP
jgi:hypothetical protein